MVTSLPFSFGSKPLIGAVHLLPLPGSPRWVRSGRPGLESIVERAVADAAAYESAGYDGVIVENYGDVPFFKVVPPQTVAAVTRCAFEVVRAVGDLPVGLNLLRNDAQAALACALAAGGRFVRINVHTGAAATDQGVIEGRAAETLRLRDALGAEPSGQRPIALLADVHVKHARPLASDSIGQAAEDAVHRGLADALIVSGAATGKAPDPGRLIAVRAAVPGVPVFLGSGLTPSGCADLVPHLDGAIVGSAAERDGLAGNPVDPARARAVLEAFRSA